MSQKWCLCASPDHVSDDGCGHAKCGQCGLYVRDFCDPDKCHAETCHEGACSKGAELRVKAVKYSDALDAFLASLRKLVVQQPMIITISYRHGIGMPRAVYCTGCFMKFEDTVEWEDHSSHLDACGKKFRKTGSKIGEGGAD